MGGIAPGTMCQTLPGIDPSAVRQAGTGGPWPPVVLGYQSSGLDVAVTGNRGVTSGRLLAAADELAEETRMVDSLLTHDVDLVAGAAIMNELCERRHRTAGGRLVMRLVVEMNAAPS